MKKSVDQIAFNLGQLRGLRMRMLDGEYCADHVESYLSMVITPPRRTQEQRLAKGQPFTSRRVCLIEESAYINHDQCKATAEFLAIAANNIEDIAELAMLAINAGLAKGADDGTPTV